MPDKLRARTSKGLTSSEQLLFTKRLALYLHSGIPIDTALGLLKDDAGSKASVSFYESILKDVFQGAPLSEALSRFPRGFDVSTQSLIRVGEKTGSLSESLTQVALILKKSRALKKKLIGAALYPFIIFLGTISLTLFLILYAFPKIVPLFNGFKTTLPLPTRVVIATSSFITHYWWLMCGVVALVIVGIAVTVHVRVMRNCVRCFLFTLPMFGTFTRLCSITRISRTLATLLQSGISVEHALVVTREGMHHPIYVQALHRTAHDIRSGLALATALRAHPHAFPLSMIQLIRAGESTGSLSQSLVQVADIYEEQLDELLQRITSLCEPILMLSMGLIVGFIALAIITPIYGLTQGMTLK